MLAILILILRKASGNSESATQFETTNDCAPLPLLLQPSVLLRLPSSSKAMAGLILQKYTRAAAAATGAAFSFIWQGPPPSEHHQHPRPPVPTYSAACEGGSGNDLFYTAAAAAGATAIAAGAGYLLGVGGGGAPSSKARTAQSQRDAALLIRSEVAAKGDAIKANYLRARHLPGSPHEHVETNDLPRYPNNGWGVFQDRDDGVIYVGEFKNGNFDGQGEYVRKNY